MNIVFLTHEFAQKGVVAGGAGNYIYNIASVLVKQGNKVFVVVDGGRREVYEYEGIEVHCINATKGFRDTGKPMSVVSKLLKNAGRSFWYNLEVRKIIRKNKVDIVQTVGTYGIPFFRSKKVPYVVRFSEHEPLWVGASKETFIYEEWANSRRLDYQFWEKAYKRADAFFAPSIFLKDIIEKKSGCEVQVIESPVNANIMVAKTSTVLEEYQLKESKYWITYCSMTYRKSIHTVAGIIDRLLGQYQDMKYVVVGKDYFITYRNERILASQLFLGNISSENRERFVFIDGIYDKARLYYLVQRAKMCVLPSRIDNLPNSVLEAMALGKIVVSSDRTSSEQLITDGYNGFLSEIENEQQLYEKIVAAMQLSEESQKEMGRKAFERVKNLTPENVCVKVLEFYGNVIRSNLREDF